MTQRELFLNILSDVDKLTSLDHIGEVHDALNSRGRELKARKARKLRQILNVGDVVRLSNNMKPRYISEVEAPIIDMDSKGVTLQFPEEFSLRRFSGVRVGVPYSAISKRISKSTS